MSAGRELAALALAAGLGGCGRAPAPRDEPRPATPPTAGGPARQASEDPMTTAKLREAIAKTIANPDATSSLELSYLRGHDLSGTTKLTVDAAGAYQLASSVTADEQPRSWSGTLAPADRDALWRAVADTHLLDVRSSTRNIADDEEPIIISLQADGLVHDVRVWHDDAGAAGLAGFEAHVNALVKKLSDGAILVIPAP